jgi:hypothetical protein
MLRASRKNASKTKFMSEAIAHQADPWIKTGVLLQNRSLRTEIRAEEGRGAQPAPFVHSETSSNPCGKAIEKAALLTEIYSAQGNCVHQGAVCMRKRKVPAVVLQPEAFSNMLLPRKSNLLH